MTMNANYPSKTYDSIEYGILLPDKAVVPQRKLKQRRMSWPKCLCITFLVILATFFIAATAILTCAYFWTKHQVERFTTTTPVQYPIHELPEAELEIVKDRAKLFYDTLRAGQTPENDLVFTEDEFNGFIAHSDFLRGNAYVQIEDNAFHADMSLPAKGLPGGKGRFFVASGLLEVHGKEEDKTLFSTELGTPYDIDGLKYPKLLLAEFLAYSQGVYAAKKSENTINLKSGQFFNWVAPADFIAKKENLLDHLCDDDDMDDEDCKELSVVLDGIEEVSITGKSIVFRPRRDSDRRRLNAVASAPGDDKTSKTYGGYARRVLKKVLF